MSDINDLIDGAASAHGFDPQTLRRIVQIESGGNPYAQTGSYHGVLQLSPQEFEAHGGGDIHDPADNINAGVAKLAGDRDRFRSKFDRDPTPTELYMIHQQGWGGAQNHIANPDQPAWQNMYATAEGRQKGPEWARRAIWGNVPDDVKPQFPGGVDSLTSQNFMSLWDQKMRGGGFPDLLSQYQNHVASMRQKYGGNGQQAGGQDQGAPPQMDPRSAMLMASLKSPTAPANTLPGGQPGSMPPYAQAGPQSLNPATMNYLKMIMATQPTMPQGGSA